MQPARRTAPPTGPMLGVRPCDGEFVSRKPLCNAWPRPGRGLTTEPEAQAAMRDAVERVLRPFRSEGVTTAWMRELMSRPCVQRLCVRVQLLDGQMYVVAPRGMRACRDSAPNATAAEYPSYPEHPKCGARARREQRGVAIPGWWNTNLFRETLEWHFVAGLNLSDCSSRVVPGDHNAQYSRLRLQSALRMLLLNYQAMHARGELVGGVELVYCANETPLNLGGFCASGAQPIFSSTSAHEAGAALIPFPQWLVARGRDADFAWRDDDDDDDAASGATAAARGGGGGGSPRSSQATSTEGNGADGTLAGARGRECRSRQPKDVRLAQCLRFCAERHAESHCQWCKCAGCRFCARVSTNPLGGPQPRPPPPPPPPPPSPPPRAGASGAAASIAGWADKAAVAVFRGGVWRLSTYAHRWRTRGAHRVQINESIWREAGRTALLAAKLRTPRLINVSMGGGLPSHSDHFRRRLNLPEDSADGSAPMMDEPEMLGLSAQQARFRYAINAEGHGGWADRLYKLLAGPQLVMMQDLPAKVWYELPLAPYRHYLPVDSAFDNLSAAVAWARRHDGAAQAMVVAANDVMRAWTSTAGINTYVQTLLRGYAPLLRQPVRRHARAVRFSCDAAYSRGATPPRGAVSSCRAPSGRPVRLREMRCAFSAPPPAPPTTAEGPPQQRIDVDPGRRFDTLFEAAVAMFGTGGK